MKKIATVIGARPQFVKAAVVSRELRRRGGVREILVHTGQHYDDAMSEVFFRELEIDQPQYNLGIGSLGHGAMTGRQLEALESVLVDEGPDVVLVYGDTNSTLAGALAAVKLHIPVAHVEAGLRSFNRRMPEEINRVVVDHVATTLFAPTEAAVTNLRREGIAHSAIHRTGDVMYDVALYFGRRAATESSVLETLGATPGKYVLATIHRQENVDHPPTLQSIMNGFGGCGMRVILPMHPRTRKQITEAGIVVPENLTIIDPVGYLDMSRLEQCAALIATDSGGVQKEAFFARVPCVTLREETEWVELVELGWNCVVPPRSAAVIATAISERVGSRGVSASPYGDGRAASAIVDRLIGP
ncbi:MAG: UDP-2,3-diacetamido-2,3-dideoxy-D-glucuronate 2-epimerase [Gammaproteobacteria bacterium]|nr:UDP-2,3-diacetamido-2,3-dideoxy-D-glucuronate 2-epimerase [Gammaproteobacteria bacterium]